MTDRNAYMREYRKRPGELEKESERHRVWRLANPEKRQAAKKRHRASHLLETREKERGARRLRPWVFQTAKSRYRSTHLEAGRTKISAAAWLDRLIEFNGACGYCLAQTKMTLEHMTPRKHGGSDSIDNIIPACGPCNSSKKDRGILAMVTRC